MLLEASLGVPFTSGNRVTVLQNGDAIFPAMLAAIAAAERWITFVTFIYWTGDVARRFAEALAAKAREGLQVEVVLDAVGALEMPDDYVRELEAAGARVTWFRPKAHWAVWRADHRTHRKILVCDGTVGFTGGVGIAEPWEGDARSSDEWRETQIRIEGPAVRGLCAGALGNLVDSGQWLEDQEFVRRLTDVRGDVGDRPGDVDGTETTPAFDDVAMLVLVSNASIGLNPAATLQHALIASAHGRLRIVTPYFVPDEETIALLCRAARRGVDVAVMFPDAHVDRRLSLIAGRRHFGRLLEAGVAIRRHTTRMVHQKILAVDGETTAIGSANLNQRSLRKDDELTAVIDDARVTAEIERAFDRDDEGCEGVDLAAWRARPWTARLAERALALVEEQL